MESEKNREVYLNFGLIAYGKLKDIEKLQAAIERLMPNVQVVYQTVSAKRLKLVKMEIGESKNGTKNRS